MAWKRRPNQRFLRNRYESALHFTRNVRTNDFVVLHFFLNWCLLHRGPKRPSQFDAEKWLYYSNLAWIVYAKDAELLKKRMQVRAFTMGEKFEM